MARDSRVSFSSAAKDSDIDNTPFYHEWSRKTGTIPFYIEFKRLSYIPGVWGWPAPHGAGFTRSDSEQELRLHFSPGAASRHYYKPLTHLRAGGWRSVFISWHLCRRLWLLSKTSEYQDSPPAPSRFSFLTSHFSLFIVVHQVAGNEVIRFHLHQCR